MAEGWAAAEWGIDAMSLSVVQEGSFVVVATSYSVVAAAAVVVGRLAALGAAVVGRIAAAAAVVVVGQAFSSNFAS